MYELINERIAELDSKIKEESDSIQKYVLTSCKHELINVINRYILDTWR